MAKIWIKTDNAEAALRRIGGILSANELKRAQARAINRSLEKGRTIARKEVKQVYNISQKYLDGIDYKRATFATLHGELFASRKPIPLDAFAPKQQTASGSISITRKGKQRIKTFSRLKSNPTAGVSIEVKKGDPEVIPYAFMIAGGAVRVFARGQYKNGTEHGFVVRHARVNKSGNDTPVKPLITVSEFGSIINQNVLRQIKVQIQSFYPDRLRHELEEQLRRAKAAGNV